MTSSNETFRRSRTHTIIAASLSAVSVVGLGVLGVQMSGLNDRFGQIAGDIDYFSAEQARLRDGRDALVSERATLDQTVAALRDEKLKLETEKAEAIRLRDTAVSDRDGAAAKLETITASLAEAKAKIAKAEDLAGDVRGLESQKRGLDRDIDALGKDKSAAATAVEKLTAEKDALSKDVDGLTKTRDDLRGQVEKAPRHRLRHFGGHQGQGPVSGADRGGPHPGNAVAASQDGHRKYLHDRG